MDTIMAFFALIFYPFMGKFIFLIVMDNKGGIGKSLISQIFANMLAFDEKYKVRMLDTDSSNSSTAQIDPEARMVLLNEKIGLGVVLRAFQEVADKLVNHIVMDVGAREEGAVKKHLPRWIQAITRLGGRVVVVRPITLGSHNQRNAADFMKFAVEHNIAVVFVRNEGQGRFPEYFDRWKKSETREKALEMGAVETYIEDADARYADEAIGYGISIADVATRDFSKIEKQEDREEAQKYFNEDIATFLNDWLRQSVLRFAAAVHEALAVVEARSTPVGDVLPDEPVPGPTKRGRGR